MRQSTLVAATMAAAVRAAQSEQTFAVLRFHGDKPMMEGRVDPIVAPGKAAKHAHMIQGGSAFSTTSTGEDLMNSECSSALIEGDNSAYWVPKLYFHDTDTGLLEDVDMYYMNVYYFFDATDDDIVSFPVGLQMIAGDKELRECPNYGGVMQIDGGNSSGIQPTQWICPRTSYDPASRPSASESDGTTAGIQDPDNVQGGQGFPFSDCDGYASPLRMDVHFPSCYDPSAGLTAYENNTAYPTIDWYTGKMNCPDGWLHVPHLFYEMYYDTPAFSSRWTPNEDYQPFVLSTGDLTGCSAHADFLAAWDEDTLQNIIDTCDAGTLGMDQCPGVVLRDTTTACVMDSPIDEEVNGNLTSLPGDNPLVGWGLSYDTETEDESEDTSYEATTAAAETTAATTTSYVAASTTKEPTKESTSTAVTTLPNGSVVTTTIVTWVTHTEYVYDTTYKTVYVNEKAKRDEHVHNHNHMHRHRSPHGPRN